MKVAITGAGIAGLTTAIALEKSGIETTIFEAAPEIKALGAGLVLAGNAMTALQKIGIADKIIERGKLLSGFTICEKNGSVINRTDSAALPAKYGLQNFAIHRAALHEVLLSCAGTKNIFTGKRAIAAIEKNGKVAVTFADGTTHETDILIVADGIHSPIRQQLVPSSKPRFAGYTCWRGIVKTELVHLTESFETWGSKGRFGLVQLADNILYWFACTNAKQNDERMKNFSIDDLQTLFKDFHSPIPKVLSLTKGENVIWNDIIDIKPIHQYAFGNIVLIGDAAHATTPNMGQGACQAIEDAAVLADELSKNNLANAALKNFEKRRIAKTRYITNTSWTLGKIAQLENKPLMAIRNFLLRSAPKSVNERMVKKIFTVDF